MLLSKKQMFSYWVELQIRIKTTVWILTGPEDQDEDQAPHHAAGAWLLHGYLNITPFVECVKGSF